MAGEGLGPIVVPCVLVNGVPYSLVVDANKYPYVNVADGLKTADLNITASKELAVLLTALVGAVETSLVAFPGGILKVAEGLSSLSRADTYGTVTSSATWTQLVSVSATGLLEWLDFSTNYKASEIQVIIDGQYTPLVGRDGVLRQAISPERLNQLTGKSALWEEDIYDDTNDYYTFSLRRAVRFNSGLIIRYRQESGEDKTIAIEAFYRSIS